MSRVWSRRGQRAAALRPIGYEWSYLFGAVCPSTGQAHGLLLPYADVAAMQLYLDDFSGSLREGVQAILVCDQAGWHTSGRVAVPGNVRLLFLPPKSPELNPSELLWREMRQQYLSNRVFADVDEVVEKVSEAWNELIASPARLQSLCGFDWITDIFN